MADLKKIARSAAVGGAVAGPAGAIVGAVDAATGDRGGKAVKQVGKELGKINPFKAPEVKKVEGPDESKLQTIDTDKTKIDRANISKVGQKTPAERAAEFNQAGFDLQRMNMGDAEAARRDQAIVAQRLRDQALGIGPSIAESQMIRAQQAALMQNRAQLASTRGGASPLAARAAMQGNQQMQLDVGERAAIARLQEQQQAAQLAGSQLEALRGQDLRTQESVAAQQNQFNELRLKYQQQGLDTEKANMMAALDIERLNQSAALEAARANQSAALDFERIRTGVNTTNTAAVNAAAASSKQFQRGLVNQAAGAGMMYATGGASAAIPARIPLATGGGAVDQQGNMYEGPQREDGSF